VLLQTYVRTTLLVAGVIAALQRRAQARRQDDTGLATLEWVALAIVAVTLAAGAAAGIKAVIDRKISQIP
jgi:heme O synthase-like polyprenyltransferase